MVDAEADALRAELAELRRRNAELTAALERTPTAAAAEALARYATLVETIDGIVWEADARTFRFRFVSQQAERLLGYPVQRWLDDPDFWRDHIHPDDVDGTVAYCVESTSAGVPHDFEYRMIAADGREVWLRDIVSVELEDGQAVTLRGVMVDVTDRRRAQQALRASEERLRLALTAARMGTWQWDLETNRVAVDGDAAPMFGFDAVAHEAPYEAFLELVHPDDRALVDERMRLAVAQARAQPSGASQPAAYEAIFRRPPGNGETRWLQARGSVFPATRGQHRRMVGTVMDVTDRRRLEAELQQAQKMETVGRLAGGVAHDFNNLLTVILGEAQLAAESLAPGSRANDALETIREAAERASQLTGQLLAFARKQVFQLQIADLNQVVQATERMLRRLIGEDVVLTTAFGANLWPVLVDAHQIGQVLVNLAVNARDAMPRGGRLTLETANVELDTGDAPRHVDLSPGQYVQLAVSDTGTGMDRAVQEHVFEPFFTTKRHGTGLGLATCYGIVHQHGGHIWLYSEPGHGTTVKVFLPRARQAAAERPTEVATADVRGTESVLLVEDAADVRLLAARGLEALGYRVIPVADGEEALALAIALPQGVDAVVTDVVLARMTGRELADRLAELIPGTPVLFVSGYTANVIENHGGIRQTEAFLQKPYTPRQLAQALRALLARPGR